MTRRRSLPKSARLRRSSEIRAILRSGRRRRCGSLDIYLRPASTGRPPRIGVVVPRHGRTIVERNRLRRRLRELLRTGWLAEERERDAPRDLLVRASAGAYARSFAELRCDLRDCLEGAP
ncbi:MAG: ribonuclease P protein component [Gemmatimonadota bacterium]